MQLKNELKVANKKHALRDLMTKELERGARRKYPKTK